MHLQLRLVLLMPLRRVHLRKSHLAISTSSRHPLNIHMPMILTPPRNKQPSLQPTVLLSLTPYR
jgi:hypothetical protein